MSTTDDTEVQIERAVERWRHVVGSEYKVRTLLQEFAAGKFREPELPAIAAPPFPYSKLYVEFWPQYESDGKVEQFRVFANSDGNEFAARGPARSTKHDAICAWNAVFGARP